MISLFVKLAFFICAIYLKFVFSEETGETKAKNSTLISEEDEYSNQDYNSTDAVPNILHHTDDITTSKISLEAMNQQFENSQGKLQPSSSHNPVTEMPAEAVLVIGTRKKYNSHNEKHVSTSAPLAVRTESLSTSFTPPKDLILKQVSGLVTKDLNGTTVKVSAVTTKASFEISLPSISQNNENFSSIYRQKSEQSQNISLNQNSTLKREGKETFEPSTSLVMSGVEGNSFVPLEDIQNTITKQQGINETGNMNPENNKDIESNVTRTNGESFIAKNVVTSNVTELKSRYIIVLLQRNCESNIFSRAVSQINSYIYNKKNNHNDSMHNVACNTVIHLKYPIDPLVNISTNSIRKTLKNKILKEFTVLKVFSADDYNISNIFSDSTLESNKNKIVFSQREIIAYAVAVLSCCAVFSICLICCCVKLCRRKQANSLDLSDIPHVNPKFNDVEFKHIPRAKTPHSDCGKNIYSTFNGRISKGDDTVLGHHNFLNDIPSSVSTLGRDFPFGRHEMRTFSGKRPCSRVQSLDVRPNNKTGNGWLSNSRERLNVDYEKKVFSGIDNNGFKKWF